MAKKTKYSQVRLDPDVLAKLQQVQASMELKPSLAKLVNLLCRNHADKLKSYAASN